jgi:enterochelin esterase-like enzyme
VAASPSAHDDPSHAVLQRGDVSRYQFRSQIFAGTARDDGLYVPSQYNPESPPALMVFQDGHLYVDETGPFRVPVVFDNLIHQKQMPVTMGAFINPGHAGKAAPLQAALSGLP